MKKRLKDELEDRNTLQEYVCPNCHQRYSALDALQLISMNSDGFHCENCNSELIVESDKLAAEEKGDGEDNGRHRRREKLRELLEKMEEQLKPLMEQIARVKDLTVPEYGSLLQWEARAIAVGRAVSGDHNANESSKSSQGQGYGGTPMPYLGETKVPLMKEVKLEMLKTVRMTPVPKVVDLQRIMHLWKKKKKMKMASIGKKVEDLDVMLDVECHCDWQIFFLHQY